ncbi:MAG: SDR family NAD(P)-dependent oxidoreductase [Candidatus Hermodarchaeota archaeon]
MSFEGKVVLVTGGTRGIGKALTKAFLAEKAKVAICSRKEENVSTALEDLDAPEDQLFGMTTHIAKTDQIKTLVAKINEKFGQIDILINNVGMNLFTPTVSEAEEGAWRKIIDTNLTGTFLVCKEVIPIMKKQNGGKIVNISSLAGQRAAPAMGIYGIAKAGIDMLTRILAMELATFNIQVNSIAPGVVRTAFSEFLWGNEELHKQIIERIPLNRIAEIKDVVHAVLFISSSKADYITGTTIVLDGGMSVVF